MFRASLLAQRQIIENFYPHFLSQIKVLLGNDITASGFGLLDDQLLSCCALPLDSGTQYVYQPTLALRQPYWVAVGKGRLNGKLLRRALLSFARTLISKLMRYLWRKATHLFNRVMRTKLSLNALLTGKTAIECRKFLKNTGMTSTREYWSIIK